MMVNETGADDEPGDVKVFAAPPLIRPSSTIMPSLMATSAW